MLDALDHVILAVRDLDAASKAYERLLGLEPSWSGAHPEYGTANVLFRVDNMYLELLSPEGSGAIGSLVRTWLADRGDGLMGFAFQTADPEACRRDFVSRGLEPGPVTPGHGQNAATGAERRWRTVPLSPHQTRGVVIFAITHDSPEGLLPLAKPSCEAGAAVHALDHVVVQSTDADATRALYRDTLGIRLAVDKEFPDWGVHLMFFRIGGVTLEVAAALSAQEAEKALPGGKAREGEDRLYGMSWRVRDIEAARERLASAGVDVSEVRTGRRPDTRVFTVRDGSCGVPTLVIELAGK